MNIRNCLIITFFKIYFVFVFIKIYLKKLFSKSMKTVFIKKTENYNIYKYHNVYFRSIKKLNIPINKRILIKQIVKQKDTDKFVSLSIFNIYPDNKYVDEFLSEGIKEMFEDKYNIILPHKTAIEYFDDTEIEIKNIFIT